MKNDSSAIISRFHLSSMLLGLIIILTMGCGVMYDLLKDAQSSNLGRWKIGILLVFGGWLLLSFKDWTAYLKLYRQNKQLINDERFTYDNHMAAKCGFISLIFSNFALLLVDLSVYPLGGAVVAIFSLTFGVSIYLLVLIIQELRA